MLGSKNPPRRLTHGVGIGSDLQVRYSTAARRKGFAMLRTVVVGFSAAAFLSSGLSAAALGTAHAAPNCWPGNAKTAPCAPPEGLPTCNADGMCGQLWCPGSGMEGIPNWDMNVCHTFYFDPNAPLTEPIIIQGNPPGPPPPPPPPCIPLVNCLPGLTHPLPM